MTDDERWEKEAAPLFQQARAESAEEPAPAAIARARAGVRDRMAARPALFPKLALAGAIAALAVAFVVWKRLEPSVAGVVVAEGSLQNGALRTGDAIALGAELSTGATSAVLAVGDAARVQLLPGTRARLVSPSELGLVDGRAKLSVARGPFRVRAAAVTLEVVGTVFEVACSGSEVQLMVSEGVVRAVRGAESWDVKAGETWPAPVLLPAPTPAAPAPAPAPVPEQQRAVQQSKLEQAQLFTRQGKLDAARALYGELAREDAPIAELALYHLAHLEAVRAKRPKLALEALDEQLRRFPNGALAPEARLSRIEALRMLGLDAGP